MGDLHFLLILILIPIPIPSVACQFSARRAKVKVSTDHLIIDETFGGNIFVCDRLFTIVAKAKLKI